MSTSLIFKDDENSEQRLEVFYSAENRCYIQVGKLDEDFHCGWVTLDSDDLTVLINELQSIKAKIDLNEQL